MNQLIDNKMTKLGDDLKLVLGEKSKVQIIASIFSIYGYQVLKEELKNIETFNFIFKDPMFIREEKQNKQEKNFEIQRANIEKQIGGTQFEVQLKNELNTRALAKECSAWIQKKATFKTNMTGKVMSYNALNVINSDTSKTYLNTTDFTSEALGYRKDNAYSYSIMGIENEASLSFINDFNETWSDTELKDITNEVIEFVKTLYKENSPEYIYYITLYNIFSEFLEDINEDHLANENIGFKDTQIYNTLYSFQKDAVKGIINKLETHNGCILADSVGLGKTFTALAVIKYYELRNKDVLVLCPKKLGDNWNTYRGKYKDNILSEDRFAYDVLYHTDLNRESGLSNGIDLSRLDWQNYGLIVIDESHNFRNNNARKDHTSRYDILMDEVIKKGIKTKVLMLSATPVNNKFTDLNNQLNLAYEGRTDQIDPKISKKKSIQLILRDAQKTFNDWSKLELEDRTDENLYAELNKNFEFFKLLDSVTIARSRKHIEKSYDSSEVGAFPTRMKPISKSPDLTDISGFMDIHEIYEELVKLNLAVYTPFEYIHEARKGKYMEMYDTVTERGTIFSQADREKSLQTLMRANFMKRLEGSVESFRLTLSRITKNIADTLDSIEKFKSSSRQSEIEGFTNYLGNDDEDFDEFTIGKKVKIDLADMDVITWGIKLKSDLKVMTKLLNDFNQITIEHDNKVQELRKLIVDKQANPLNVNNKKVIVFTSFADTAKYLYEAIEDLGNVALITGSDVNKNNIGLKNDFNNLLLNFSPISKHRDKIQPNAIKDLDILIATDCISEGQNLQDCDYLINYDIHWNPVRIIQRFGRIDRIGSKNKYIQLVNFWPNVSLDEYINLKNRVEDRMKMLDLSATGSDNVLDDKAREMEYRKQQLEQLKEEVLDLEEVSNSISITDLGLNDFRMDLIEYTNKNGDIANVSTGLHSVINKTEYYDSGVIFILKNINKELDVENQNQIHPFYLVHINDDGGVKHNHLSPKQTLDFMRKTCKGNDIPIQSAYEKFNNMTDDGKNMSTYSDLLSQAINTIIDINEESTIDSLFSNSDIVINGVKGLDDFELIAFIAIV